MSTLPANWRLPSDWKMKPLGEVATLQRGFDLPVQARQEGKIKIFAANGPVGTHNIHKVRGPGVVTGRSGSIGKVHYVEEDFWPLNTALWVKDFHGNDPRWVSRLLTWMRLEKFTRGVGVPTLNRNLVHEETIPLPPLEEQKRIAGILDQADALRRLRTRALDKLNTLGLAIFHEMFGDPVTNPNGLPSTGLGELSTFTSGATPAKSNPDFWDGEIPWVTPKDMKVHRIEGSQDRVTSAAVAGSTLKTIPAGTPLIVVRGMILAHTVPLAVTAVDCTINQDMKAIRFSDEILPEFGLFCLKAQHNSLLGRVDTAAHGTKRFDMSELSKAPMLIPGSEAQEHFITALHRAESVFSCCGMSAGALDNLFFSLQSRAFRGEL